ncbi:MAG: DDE-type integrase/transposase/recombinase [Flavobacteriales bacterium]|nr:DDE-type integrase/transposase/recombinase [Flavobacteriales bacterium]
MHLQINCSERKRTENAVFHAREELVDVVQRVRSSIGIAKAVRALGISRTTFQNWLLETKVKCNHSYFGWCNRIRPYQLSHPEVAAIRKLVTDERFQYWPLSSIFHHGLREKTVSMCLSTFYRYVRLLGIKRVKYKKPPPKKGLRAERPHDLWHTDVTILKMNGQKRYLHLLMDNYSRYILNWKLQERLFGTTVRTMLVEALENYRPNDVRLMVDGGSENNNLEVDDLIKHSGGTIRKLIAQKEIDFSNSMVESVNNLIKNGYLRPMGTDDPKQLPDSLEGIINDINNIRPHNAIGGLIPFEALNGITINTAETKRQLQKARAKRLEYNRKNTCNKCI